MVKFVNPFCAFFRQRFLFYIHSILEDKLCAVKDQGPFKHIAEGEETSCSHGSHGVTGDLKIVGIGVIYFYKFFLKFQALPIMLFIIVRGKCSLPLPDLRSLCLLCFYNRDSLTEATRLWKPYRQIYFLWKIDFPWTAPAVIKTMVLYFSSPVLGVISVAGVLWLLFPCFKKICF